ncbi:FixH family protein [Thermomonas sp.]|jgi:hypothetical protein|uniref:FixH family protein n=1 Tax=Thermomonas sp. TaxID=1971895 RepID=UPI001ACC6638|nr:FixH family protein [Xanthomonadales bacterium]MBN8794458.1 FixH family protein [Stenotrophomonas nitritireducens]
MDTRSSPWRQPVVWLMLLMVGLVVVAGIAMVVVATADGPMDAVPDAVQRTGQAQQADLDPDAHAARLQLAAIMRMDGEHGFVEVLPVSGDFDHAAPLRLHLQHPARADADLVLTLAPHETGWRANATPSQDHDWLLRLEPASAPTWRLQGRLPRHQQATRLGPALHDGAP